MPTSVSEYFFPVEDNPKGFVIDTAVTPEDINLPTVNINVE